MMDIETWQTKCDADDMQINWLETNFKRNPKRL